MSEQLAEGVGPSRITIAYERLGEPRAPALLLIMGLGGQLTTWPDGFCHALVARGLQVVRFDNRDAGRSTRFDLAPVPRMQAVVEGDHSSVGYTLSDMAADAVGLLDVLGIGHAHVVGASMGGAIAQHLALEHAARVPSLTCMMATTGAAAVGQPDFALLRQVFDGAPRTTEAQVVENMVKAARLFGSPAFPFDEEEARARAVRSFARGWNPLAVARQAVATIASGDRTARLRGLAVPTLVIHGAADRMIDPSGGRAIAAAVPGAELVVLEGMGHDVPKPLWPTVVDHIARHVERAESRAT